jgi:hypothetical protein
VGSNHRPLACKAEYGQDYAQLTALVHASELQKQCPEMPWGAWESLHGGSRKWFPEQPADPRFWSELRPGGGAIRIDTVPYVDFLIPGMMMTSVLITGTSDAVGVAEDSDQGFSDRLRSLPAPIALPAGRVRPSRWRTAGRA